jgi:putative ABC transport system permease protein
VLTVTMCMGLTSTALDYGNVAEGHGTVQVNVSAGRSSPPNTAATQVLLQSLAGAAHVDASIETAVTRVGGPTPGIFVNFVRGYVNMGGPIVRGHYLDGPYQAVVPPGFLSRQDVTIGSHMTLDMGGKPATVTIVGETWAGADTIQADWHTLSTLAPRRQADLYSVQLTSGASVSAYIAAVRKAAPGLDPAANNGVNAGAALVATSATLFTVLLAIVAALGVFNTVVLSTRERRRDLGMLKSIGMTPREVTAMMVTSMAELGVVGTLIGLPLGILAHRIVTSAVTGNAYIILPAYMINVWSAALVGALAFSGLVIAILGAYIPARSAARLTIATVLHNE